MYCPSCGAESTVELNYCNRCGANLSSPLTTTVDVAPMSVTSPILIIGAMVTFVTCVGFMAVIEGTIQMIQKGAGEVSAAIPIFGMPTILIIDILLIRQLSKLISAALSANQPSARTRLAQPQSQSHLQHPTTSRLEPAPSVTENTTRFFDPVYREPVPAPTHKDLKK